MAQKTEDRNVPEKPGAAHRWKDQHSVQGLVSEGGMGLWRNTEWRDGPVEDGLVGMSLLGNPGVNGG